MGCGVVEEEEEEVEEVMGMGMGLIEYREGEIYTTWYSTAHYIHYAIMSNARCNMPYGQYNIEGTEILRSVSFFPLTYLPHTMRISDFVRGRKKRW